MRYERTIFVKPDLLQTIDAYLEADNEEAYQGRNETISFTAVFDNGLQVDVKCCGCSDQASWAEAVLFDENGRELGCTEPEGSPFSGEYCFFLEGDEYVVSVQAGKEEENADVI